MLKAAREAKVHTQLDQSRTRPTRPRCEGFVRALLAARGRQPRSSTTCRRWRSTLAWFGVLNSLSMTLLKLTSPGVPDIYQGNELMDLSLVDPDNRRPVDYALRARCWTSSRRWRGLTTCRPASPRWCRCRRRRTRQAVGLLAHAVAAARAARAVPRRRLPGTAGRGREGRARGRFRAAAWGPAAGADRGAAVQLGLAASGEAPLGRAVGRHESCACRRSPRACASRTC